jgi:hypothetical protein
MKKTSYYTILIIVTLFTSCQNSDNSLSDNGDSLSNSDENNQIKDDYKLLVSTKNGQLYEIGNNTGNTNKVGQINNIISSPFVRTITSSKSKIFLIEYISNPNPTNNLLIYNRQTKTTESISLKLPSSIIGDEPSIIDLYWNGNNLIGVLSTNGLISNSPKYLITINTSDYSITNTGITFNQDSITSLVQVDNKVYISTLEEGFLEIDLITNSVNELMFDGKQLNGWRLAVINKTKLALMQVIQGSSSTNSGKPVEINFNNKSIVDKSNNTIYGLADVFGSSIFRLTNNEYINLIYSNDSKLSILRCNFITGQIKLVKINNTDITSSLKILDIVD